MPDFDLPQSFQTFDWFILGLRIAFILLVYFFLYQVARVTLRELVTLGSVTSESGRPRARMPDPSSAIEIIDPAESSYDHGTAFPLDHYTTVGRYEDNTVELDDDFVSGSHAEIYFENGQWWIQDLNSTNGTFLNTQRMGDRLRLSNGDIVQFGRIRTRIRL